jgi:hypothetical protein
MEVFVAKIENSNIENDVEDFILDIFYELGRAQNACQEWVREYSGEDVNLIWNPERDCGSLWCCTNNVPGILAYVERWKVK